MAYIDRAYLTEQFESLLQDDNVMCPIMKVLDALEIIDTAPSADVSEIVRCKDCGSYNKHYGECTLNGSHFGENGYCCKGTRTKERGGEK